eukprot:TRINITY_DN1781_c0_g1_i7.p1 TRINITY_DN1781_c0_g1~~TRINITY_DN1781_c0_g1_i7.p1  ORF type:complete len:158 (-),score=34.61 TRINITY_DN1781_c0_g1_i7:16-489(-)
MVTLRSKKPLRNAPMHCIFFFLPLVELYINKCTQRLAEFVTLATQLDVPAFVILSLADRVLPDFAKTGVISPELSKHVKAAALQFNLPEVQIVPVVNYANTPTKDHAIDKIVLRALERAVKLVQGFVARQQQSADDLYTVTGSLPPQCSQNTNTAEI